MDAQFLHGLNDEQRAQIHAALSDARNRTAAVLNTVVDGVVTISVDGTIETFNPSAERLFGYSASEVIGTNVRRLMPASYANEHDGYLANYLETGEARVIGIGREVIGRRKDGSEFPMELSVSDTRLDSDRVFTGIVRDISARKEAEAALREAAARARAIVSTAVDGIVVIDHSGVIDSFNPAAERIFGYSAAEVIGRNVSMLMPEPFRSEHDGYLENFLATGEAKIIGIGRQVQGLRKNGHAFPMDLAIADTPLADRHLFTGTVRDLTERQTQETLFERLFTLIPDMLAIVGLDGTIQRANPAFGRILGYTPGDLAGQQILDLVDEEDREAAEMWLHRMGRGEALADFVNRVRCSDGARRIIAWSAFPSLDEGRVFAAGRDITELRAAEDQRQDNIALQAANSAKTEFLSRMSHELRTPLNVILGFAQVLQLDPLPPSQEESVSHILQAGKHLLTLIDEVLDISRIESGTMSLSIEPILVADVLAEATSLIRTLAVQRRIQLRTFGDPSVYVVADRQRLTQVLLNLLSNGVKYNTEGGELTVSWMPTEEDRLRVSISDTGVGIAPAAMGRLFTPFDRLGAEASLIPGSGLGLALSRRLIENMGGSISAERRVGGGMTFTFELRRAIGPGPDIEEIAQRVAPLILDVGKEQTNILYIEDNLANLAVVQAILTRTANIRLFSAMQGRLGIELAREHQPDLILLDLQLPDLPGEEVLHELKNIAETASIPVVVVSANVSRGWQARLTEQGAFAVLAKPINVREFSETIERALQPGRTAAPGS